MTASPTMFAYEGQEVCGRILQRGRHQFEAIDREGASLGIFETAAAAARAIFDNATNDERRS
jgi:hypothetical protein